MKSRPQFIAGAVCPQCHEIDSLMLDKSKHQIHCVSCEFVETSQQRDEESKPTKASALDKAKAGSTIKITNLDN